MLRAAAISAVIASSMILLLLIAGARMRALIGSLLRFVRAGSIAMDQDIDLSCRHALDQALENLALPLSEARASLEIGELPRVHFDGIQLNQVFQNLIGNALK